MLLFRYLNRPLIHTWKDSSLAQQAPATKPFKDRIAIKYTSFSTLDDKINNYILNYLLIKNKFLKIHSFRILIQFVKYNYLIRLITMENLISDSGEGNLAATD